MSSVAVWGHINGLLLHIKAALKKRRLRPSASLICLVLFTATVGRLSPAQSGTTGISSLVKVGFGALYCEALVTAVTLQLLPVTTTRCS